MPGQTRDDLFQANIFSSYQLLLLRLEHAVIQRLAWLKSPQSQQPILSINKTD